MKIYEIPIYVNVDGEDMIVCPERVSWDGIRLMMINNGPYVFSCQNLLNPIPESEQKFKKEWIKTWSFNDLMKRVESGERFRMVMCCDPASTKGSRSDYTAITVHGFDALGNWYWFDIYHDKLDNEEDRALKIFEMHRKWNPLGTGIMPVMYEAISFQVGDIHLINKMQEELNYKFQIIPLSGGAIHKSSKVERIKGMQPFFSRNIAMYGKQKTFIPQQANHFMQFKKKSVNMVEEFLYEYTFFTPNLTHAHDDILDTGSFVMFWEGFQIARGSAPMIKQEPKSYTVGDMMADFASNWARYFPKPDTIGAIAGKI